MTTGRASAWMLLGLCVATLALLLVSAILYSAQQTNAIRENQRTNTETLDRIKDCTTIGRKCFERGQKATAKAVGDINRVAIYAAACADRPRRQTVEAIQACVIARLAESARP